MCGVLPFSLCGRAVMEGTHCLLSYLRFKRQERSYGGDYDTAHAVDTALFKGYRAAAACMGDVCRLL